MVVAFRTQHLHFKVIWVGNYCLSLMGYKGHTSFQSCYITMVLHNVQLSHKMFNFNWYSTELVCLTNAPLLVLDRHLWNSVKSLAWTENEPLPVCCDTWKWTTLGAYEKSIIDNLIPKLTGKTMRETKILKEELEEKEKYV